MSPNLHTGLVSSSVPLLATKLKSFILKYVPKVPKSNNELITYKTNENRNTVLADF